MWDIMTGKMLTAGPFHCRGGAFTVAFSPDGELIAAGGSSGYIHFWRTDTGEQAREPLDADSWPVNLLAFSPDGTRILSRGEDNAVQIWNVSTGQPVLALQCPVDSVVTAAWSFDGRIIGTGSKDGTVRVWDATTGEQLAMLHGTVRQSSRWHSRPMVDPSYPALRTSRYANGILRRPVGWPRKAVIILFRCLHLLLSRMDGCWDHPASSLHGSRPSTVGTFRSFLVHFGLIRVVLLSRWAIAACMLALTGHRAGMTQQCSCASM